MAFYEMLPGAGMPPGLQAGMDSVLNKKFGTSTTYPAEDWPDTVNLMGPLPEKTTSGAIVTFSDGADEVPIKSLEVTLPASLDGYSSVDVVHYEKNLANFSGHAEPTYSGLTITANADGSITFSGTPSRTWAHLTTDFAVDFPIGTYTLSRGASASYAMYIAVKYEDNTTENISMATSASKTFTTSKRIIQIRLDIATLNQSTNYNETVFAQLESGSSASDFEPYEEPTIYDVEIPNPNPNLRLTADVDDGMWTTSGTINPSSGGGFGRALTMAVSEKTTYDIYGLLDDLIVYLDSNKTMLSYERLSNTAMSLQNERKTTPANCAYIGLSALAFDVSSVSVKESFLVYGGSIDVVAGQGESTHANVKVSDLTWIKQTASDRDFFIAQVPTMKSGIPEGQYNDIVSDIPYGGELRVSSMADKSLASWTTSLRIYDTDITTVSELLEAYGNDGISYPLATPIDFTFTPITPTPETALGVNNFWADSGDSSVTYRADINLALGGN